MDQQRLVDADLVHLGLAAPAVDVGNARDGLEPALQNPVLDGLEVHHRIAGRPYHAVAQDLTDRAFRRNTRLGAVGQRRQLRQPVQHLLLGFLVGVVVGKLHLHVRQPEQRDRAHRRNVGNAGQLDFQRNGDVALDLLGRLAVALGDDVHQRRHRIGVGLDVELEEADHAGGEQHQHQHKNQHALLERQNHDGVHVSCPAARGR